MGVDNVSKKMSKTVNFSPKYAFSLNIDYF